ncbi:MAG: hypothetical protein JWO70_710 [Betaproteobacteria bacterium]|nr:hypothetical protein [Betaproteobacteria bacterium]
MRNVPVVAKGESFVFGQNLEDVAEFVGLQGTGHTPLPPDVLVGKWVNVLRAAQRLVRQIPDDKMGERVIPNRDRAIRLLTHHVFRIGEAFLETVIEGVDYAVQHANKPPAEGTYTQGPQVAEYGGQVISRIEAWWAQLADKSGTQMLPTYYGPQPLHQVLERSTWHSAQHSRQLAAVLERYDIQPDGALTPQDLAGLPLPERLWE